MILGGTFYIQIIIWIHFTSLIYWSKDLSVISKTYSTLLFLDLYLICWQSRISKTREEKNSTSGSSKLVCLSNKRFVMHLILTKSSGNVFLGRKAVRNAFFTKNKCHKEMVSRSITVFFLNSSPAHLFLCISHFWLWNENSTVLIREMFSVCLHFINF